MTCVLIYSSRPSLLVLIGTLRSNSYLKYVFWRYTYLVIVRTRYQVQPRDSEFELTEQTWTSSFSSRKWTALHQCSSDSRCSRGIYIIDGVMDMDVMICLEYGVSNYNAWRVISIFLIRKRFIFFFFLFLSFYFYCNQTSHRFIDLSNELASPP